MAGRVEGKGPLEERTFERTNPSTGFVEVVPALVSYPGQPLAPNECLVCKHSTGQSVGKSG